MVGFFLCRGAVYHPVMTALKWITAALVAMLAFPAHADVSGLVCVTDGDTLVVNGKRQRTRCVGGTRVRLFGIDAPELMEGEAVWIRIVKAIEELLSEERPEDAEVH